MLERGPGANIRQVLEEGARRWLEDQKKVLPILADRGWVPTMDMMPRHLTDLLELHATRGGEAMDNLMVELCEPGCMLSMRTQPKGGMFEPWAAAFSAAAAAHERGEYGLAIPVWLIAIEGLVGGSLQEERFYSKVRRKVVERRVRAALAVPNSFVDEFAEAWVRAIRTVAESTSHADPAILNRNAVLHGQVPAIGGRRDSVQGMQLLTLFRFLLNTGTTRKARPKRAT